MERFDIPKFTPAPSAEEMMQGFMRTHKIPKSDAEAEELFKVFFKQFNLPEEDPDFRKKVMAEIHEGVVEAKDTAFRMARESAFQMAGVDASYRLRVAKYDKKCKKLSSRITEHLFDGKANNLHQFYGDLRELFDFGMTNLRGYDEAPDVEVTDEILDKFAENLDDALAAVHLPSMPCVSGISEEEVDERRKPQFVGKPKIPVPVTADNDVDFAAEEQEIIQYVKDTYFPYIAKSNDFAVLYPMTNIDTGETALFSREQFNHHQRLHRDDLEKMLRNQDEERIDTLESYMRTRMKFTVTGNAQFIGPPKPRSRSRTRKVPGSEESSEEEAAPSTASSTSWWQRWLSPAPPREKTAAEAYADSLRREAENSPTRPTAKTRGSTRITPAVQIEAAVDNSLDEYNNQPAIRLWNYLKGVSAAVAREKIPAAKPVAEQQVKTKQTGSDFMTQHWQVIKKLAMISVLTYGMAQFTADPLVHPMLLPTDGIVDLQQTFRTAMDSAMIVSQEDIDRHIIQEQITASVYLAGLERTQTLYKDLTLRNGFSSFSEFIHFARAQTIEGTTFESWNIAEWRMIGEQFVGNFSLDVQTTAGMVAFLAEDRMKSDLHLLATDPTMKVEDFYDTYMTMGLFKTKVEGDNALAQMQLDTSNLISGLLKPDDAVAAQRVQSFLSHLRNYRLDASPKTAARLLDRYLVATGSSLPAAAMLAKEFGSWNTEIVRAYGVAKATTLKINEYKRLPEKVRDAFAKEFNQSLLEADDQQKMFWYFVATDPEHKVYFNMRNNTNYSDAQRETVLAKAARHFIAIYPDAMYSMTSMQQGLDKVALSNAWTNLKRREEPGFFETLKAREKEGVRYYNAIEERDIINDIPAAKTKAEEWIKRARKSYRFWRLYMERFIDASLRWIVFAMPGYGSSVLQHSLNFMLSSAIVDLGFFGMEASNRGLWPAWHRRMKQKSENLVEQLANGVPKTIVLASLAFLHLDLLQWMFHRIGYEDIHSISWASNTEWATDIYREVKLGTYEAPDSSSYIPAELRNPFAGVAMLLLLRQSAKIIFDDAFKFILSPARFMLACMGYWETSSYKGTSQLVLRLLRRNPVTPFVTTALIYGAMHQPVQEWIVRNVYPGFTPFEPAVSLGQSLLDSHFEWHQVAIPLSDYADIPKFLWDSQRWDRSLEIHRETLRNIRSIQPTLREPAFETLATEVRMIDLLNATWVPSNVTLSRIKSIQELERWLAVLESMVTQQERYQLLTSNLKSDF